MWKFASICAAGAVATSLALSAVATAAPGIATKPVATEGNSAVQSVYWRIVCHGHWHHKRCHRVWVPGHRWHWRR
jgi:hypothetical protein